MALNAARGLPEGYQRATRVRIWVGMPCVRTSLCCSQLLRSMRHEEPVLFLTRPLLTYTHITISHGCAGSCAFFAYQYSLHPPPRANTKNNVWKAPRWRWHPRCHLVLTQCMVCQASPVSAYILVHKVLFGTDLLLTPPDG